VTALVDLVEIDELVIATLGPAFWRTVDLGPETSLYWLTNSAISSAQLYWENNANNFNAATSASRADSSAQVIHLSKQPVGTLMGNHGHRIPDVILAKSKRRRT
jgi:hypothetical protein